MKYLSKIFLSIICLATILASCDKANVTPNYKTGVGPVLSSNTTTVAADPSDSDNVVLQFAYTNPQFATSDQKTDKFILQFDSTGKNFANPVSFPNNATLGFNFTGRQLNNLILNSFGLNIGVPYSFDVRLISSYGNNNDQKISNVITLSITAYAIPPKVAPPVTGHLYLVGNASDGGWNNPVPVPSQEFAKLDSVTYAGVFHLTGGNQYLLLPKNGDWSSKYALPNGGLSGVSSGGDFQFYTSGGDNFPAPATTGWYIILVNFQTGKFTVTPLNDKGEFTGNLFITGDATTGWNNPVPAQTQQFIQDNSAEYHLTIPLTAGGGYILLPTNGVWQKYAVDNGSLPGLWAGGAFALEGGGNIPAPPTTGTYTITVNFATMMFTVTQ